MKKFAKISAVLVAMALAFSFAGCSDGSSGGGSDSSEITGGGTSGGETSGGETSGGETSGGETSGGETSGGETSGGETSGGETSGGETSGGETSSDKYSITYELDGGTNASGNPASYTIETVTVTLKVPTKDGYTFDGWYESSNFSGTAVSGWNAGEKTENITLYAKWLVADKFIKVSGVSIDGSETWTPGSDVFEKGRALNLKAFYMSDHEVTQAEWKAVMETTPSGMASTVGTASNNPVNKVSWYDAIVYCNKRSIKENLTPCYTISGSTDTKSWGTVPTSNNDTWNAATCDWNANGYRLPTEAEWEWAARGGENYTYAGSDDINEVAWYYNNTNVAGTREVKTKKSNGYGIYDMSGNVFEWCWDWYGNISSSTPEVGASSGSYRVVRGGYYDDFCEVAFRNYDYPYYRDFNLGFRIVRSAQ